MEKSGGTGSASKQVHMRRLLHVSNGVFVAFGITMIVLAAYAIQDAELDPTGLPGGIIFAGSFLIALAICGSIAAQKGSREVLLLYSVFLTLLVIVQLMVAIGVLAARGQAAELLRHGWNTSEDDTRSSIQDNFNCCGFRGPLDGPGTQNCGGVSGASNYNGNYIGCFTKLEDNLTSSMLVVGVTSIVFLVFEIFGIHAARRLRAHLYSPDGGARPASAEAKPAAADMNDL